MTARASGPLGGHVRLTRRGWWFFGFAAVSFIGAYAGGRQEFLYVACLLSVLPIAAVIIVLTRRPRIDVARSFSPPLIQAGETTSVRLAVRNSALAPSIAARWCDTLPWHPSSTPESVLPGLQPRGVRFAGRGNSVSLGYSLRPPRRGVFAIGPLRIEVTDPFALARWGSIVGPAAPITVTPEVIALADTGLAVAAGDGESRLMQRRATGNDDDITTREYRAGDALRRVHWRASARHGDLMVRQEEQRSFPEARIIVDSVRASYRDVSSDEVDDSAESDAFEWVVAMLASVAVHLRRAGFLVSVQETGPEQLESLARHRTWGDEELLTQLASFRLTETVRLPSGVARGSSGPLVALVGHPDEETIEWMLTQHRPGDLAVAFMVRSLSALDQLDRSLGTPPTRMTSGARLEAAGWLVVHVRADDDLARAWDAVAIDVGRYRGSA